MIYLHFEILFFFLIKNYNKSLSLISKRFLILQMYVIKVAASSQEWLLVRAQVLSN